jgi:hypothetical protein
MMWLAWLLCTLAFVLVGGAFMRAGRTGIVKAYALACAVFFVLTLFRFGYVFGEAFAAWPWIICTALVPATAILAFVAVQRDRAEVMGRAGGGREAVAASAVMYGAGAMHDSGGMGAGGGAEM